MTTIGTILRDKREELDLSQEDVCEGICSVSTLSRIENGNQNPSQKTLMALLGKLKLTLQIFPQYILPHEVEINELERQISDLIDTRQYKKAEQHLQKLEKIKLIEPLTQRYMLLCRAIIGSHTGDTPEESLKKMREITLAIAEDFNPKKILRHLLTKDDLSIISHLGVAYERTGDTDTAMEIYQGVVDYVEHKVSDKEAISPVYTLALYCLSRLFGLAEDYEEELRLASIGIENAIKWGRLRNLPLLLTNKGCALVELKRKEEGATTLQEAYYLFRTLGQLDKCDLIQDYAQKNDLKI